MKRIDPGWFIGAAMFALVSFAFYAMWCKDRDEHIEKMAAIAACQRSER